MKNLFNFKFKYYIIIKNLGNILQLCDYLQLAIFYSKNKFVKLVSKFAQQFS